MQKYPSTVEKDIAMLKACEVPGLFLPSVEEVYPEGISVGLYMIWADWKRSLKANSGPGIFREFAW